MLITTSLTLSLLIGPVQPNARAQTAPPAAEPAPAPQAPAPQAQAPQAQAPQAQAPQGPPSQAAALPGPPLATPDMLNQVVAPIALYPDALVAQILPAAAFPSQIAEAEAWLQQHPSLSGEALAQSVNGQDWDPSVKALTQLPTVLASMNQNLPWTVALGIDYGQQPGAVLAAVQTMRQRAEQAGSLEKCTQGEKIVRQGPVIELQPVNPEVISVPAYDPWVVYGPPIPVYPAWVEVPGAYITGPEIVFGVGIGIATFAAFGWGWHHWGTNWGARNVVFNSRPYFPHAFAGRPGFAGSPGFAGRPGLAGRPGVAGGRPGIAGHARVVSHSGAIGRPGFAGRPVGAGRPGFAGGASRPVFGGPGGGRPGFARASAPGGGFRPGAPAAGFRGGGGARGAPGRHGR